MSRESGKRVLLVDDEMDILVVMKDGLQKAGFSVRACRDSVTALENFAPGRYDLVITDIRMPGMNGLDLYQKIKSVDPQTPVIFLSAYDMSSAELSFARRLDPDAVIIYKPVGMKEFLAREKCCLAARALSSPRSSS
ncbi:MAG: response regulator [Nitrososphaera sp.]|uniref:response regulator n=1 Tax=Nitrososphaera sp. TaxID=1971748 RepID=UPI003D6FEF89